MAKIIRYCVLEEEHNGANVFKCHRPYIFGNPYIVNKQSKFKGLIKVSSIEECLKLYNLYFDKSINENPEFKKEWDKLIEAYYNNEVIYLGCYCKMNQNCHVDVIKKKIEQHVIKENIKKILNNKNETRRSN